MSQFLNPLIDYPMFRSSLLAVILTALVTTGNAADGKLPYHRQEDVIYHRAHGVAMVADIFTPTQSPNGRAIVVVASGAWSSDRGKIRDLNRAGLFEELCARGFHVFAIRPGSLSRFSAHDMKAKVEAGLRWVKGRAEEYSIDPSKMGLFGASAGGHLASLVAVTNPSTDSQSDASVAAVGVFFPPTDFLDFGGVALDPRKEGRLNQILEGLAFRDRKGELSDAQVRKGSIAISPARLVSKEAPPFLVIHGDSDPAVPLQQSQTLVAALKQSDVSVKLIVKEGGGHPWPTIREEVIIMAEWFQASLQAP